MNNNWNNEEYNHVHGVNQGSPNRTSGRAAGIYPGASLAYVAAALGIASLVTAFIMPFILPGVLGSLAVILAILSKGRAQRMSGTSRLALGFGTAGLVVYIIMMMITCLTAYQMLTNPSMREMANEYMTQLYGESLDDLLRSSGIDSFYITPEGSAEDL